MLWFLLRDLSQPYPPIAFAPPGPVSPPALEPALALDTPGQSPGSVSPSALEPALASGALGDPGQTLLRVSPLPFLLPPGKMAQAAPPAHRPAH